MSIVKIPFKKIGEEVGLPVGLPAFAPISIAVMAASNPLFPALVPARSTACSMLSVVRTPNDTTTFVWRETWATPFDTSPAT